MDAFIVGSSGVCVCVRVCVNYVYNTVLHKFI